MQSAAGQVGERRTNNGALKAVQCAKCNGANLKADTLAGLQVWACSCSNVFPRLDTEYYDKQTGLIIQPWQDRRDTAATASVER